MKESLSSRLAEAEELLQTVNSWTEEQVEELPKLYQEKAREYRASTEER